MFGRKRRIIQMRKSQITEMIEMKKMKKMKGMKKMIEKEEMKELWELKRKWKENLRTKKMAVEAALNLKEGTTEVMGK
jgi:hypothetical protein